VERRAFPTPLDSEKPPSRWRWVTGRALWRAFSNDLGVVPVSVVPIWLAGALMSGVIIVANLLAIGPALLARWSKATTLLRSQ
jgi:hypothetical protein